MSSGRAFWNFLSILKVFRGNSPVFSLILIQGASFLDQFFPACVAQRWDSSWCYFCSSSSTWPWGRGRARCSFPVPSRSSVSVFLLSLTLPLFISPLLTLPVTEIRPRASACLSHPFKPFFKKIATSLISFTFDSPVQISLTTRRSTGPASWSASTPCRYTMRWEDGFKRQMCKSRWWTWKWTVDSIKCCISGLVWHTPPSYYQMFVLQQWKVICHLFQNTKIVQIVENSHIHRCAIETLFFCYSLPNKSVQHMHIRFIYTEQKYAKQSTEKTV